MSWFITLLWAATLSGAAPDSNESKYFRIDVVDAETGRGVPLVELATVNAIRLYTDSNGIVAFHEPGLMNTSVFFHVKSHGYEFPKDGFGIRGRALDVRPGGHARLEIRRVNIAERLYRLTGGGIYRDSVLVNAPVPIRHPVLNGLVFGQDSVCTLVYRDRIYWFWGDTSRPRYPLGNFHMSGATSRLPGEGGLDPETGVHLEYFVNDEGFSREMAQMPGEGPTWLEGLVVLKDAGGRERIYGSYAKIRPGGGVEVHDRGLAVYDDEKQKFQKVASLPLDAPIYPTYLAFKRQVDGTEYVYFTDPYPLTRVRANPEAYCRLDSYESFTCLEEGSRLEDPRLDRDRAGKLRYAWRRNTPAVGPREQEKLIRQGKLKREETWLRLQDADTGKAVLAHRASVEWNPFRKRWVMVVCEQFGTSPLGEIWYAEADTPLGPWVYARKVVTHEQYTFYNPRQHAMLQKENGRIIFFEGTYTHTFSGNPDRTPRYDYNQILYKLDLSDPRLVLPVPVYRVTDRDGNPGWKTAGRAGRPPADGRIVFFALDRPRSDTVPAYVTSTPAGRTILKSGVPPEGTEPVFHGLPPDTEPRPVTVLPLHEDVGEDERREYSTAESPRPGFQRSESPVIFVWRNPMAPGIRWGRIEMPE